MTVRDLIKKLLDYNQDAQISPLANNKQQPFSVSYGGAEGCKKETCSFVYIDCDDINQHEAG